MKKFYLIFICTFFAAIIVPTAVIFASADRDFSDNENRTLQTAPLFDLESVLSGDFQSELTDYLSDQFPLRDKLTALGTRAKKLLGYRDIGGAYLGSDGYYFEKITQNDVNEEKLVSNLELINAFSKQNSKIPSTALLVPAAGTVLREKLPKNAQMYDAQKLYSTAESTLSAVRLCDLYSLFCDNSDDELYYRTDHHWTTCGGARLAYEAFSNGKGACNMEPELYSDSFLGTTYSKTLDSAAQCDSVYLIPVSEGITVTADGEEVPFYDESTANEKDKYRVFLGGNHGLTVIDGGCDNGKTLLVIKDSYANSLVPYLTYDYETIVMIDLRYYMLSPQSIIDEMQVDEILYVFEMSAFSNDTNIVKLNF